MATTKSEAAARPSDCDSPDSKLHWISKGKNWIRFSDRVLLEKVCCMFPGGSGPFDVDRMCVSDPVRLQLVTVQLIRGDIDLQIQAVEDSGLEGTHKVQKKSKLQARLSCWSPKGERVSGIAVYGPDGTPASSTDSAFGLLADHWSPVFNSGGGVPSAMEKFRKYVQPFPDTVEPVTREQFSSLLSVSRHSASSPDGIVYDAWTQGGNMGVGILYACYSSILVDPCVPEWLNCSLMTFIPKGDVNDHDASVQAKPGEFRPLSLSNRSETACPRCQPVTCASLLCYC